MGSTLAETATSTNASADRRRHPRYRFAAPISVHASTGLPIPAMILEISEHGLSAVLASPVDVGGTVQLDPAATGTITAQVRYQVGKVYGFEFLQLTEDQTTRLRNVCRRLPRYPPNKMGI
jgi:PilZ domain-containing protein